jgi:ATP-dependent helicase/nuclease subunit A
MLNPNATQRLASDPEYSVYVSASAGTGKTKILCDRFLRLMLNGSPCENILCVTFTTAAAAEMAERIRLKLQKWKKIDDNELIQELTELTGAAPQGQQIKLARTLDDKFLANLSRVKIQTLHSFCMDVLRCYLSPEQPMATFEILDSYQRKKFLKEAMTNVINKSEMQKSIQTLGCFYDYTGVLRLLTKIALNRSKFLQFISRYRNEDELTNAIYDEHEASISITPEELQQNFWQQLPDEIFTIAERLNDMGKPQLKHALIESSPSLFKAFFFTQEGSPRKKLLLADYMRKFPDDLALLTQESERFSAFESAYNAQISAQANAAITMLAYAVLHEYETVKQREGYLEYDDLLLKTIELLQTSEQAASVLYSLDYRIDHILVDEAQDLSPEQWEIIKLLSAEFFAGDGARELTRTIFVVGDYKQSIYSFQGADPEVFKFMKDYFRQQVTEAEQKWQEVDLEVSFRTTAPVLNSVDKVFPTTHVPHRHGQGHVEVLELIAKAEKTEAASGWILPQMQPASKSPRHNLADSIAHSIASWLGKGRLLAGHNRPITPGDIMILVRKRSDFTKILSASFSKLGIACVNQDSIRLANELIAHDLLALAKFVLLPTDDFNLACLLKSPIIGVDEDTLFKYAFGRQASLYEALQNTETCAYLDQLTNKAQGLQLYEFFASLLEIDGKRLAFVSRFGGRANYVLDQFLEAVLRYESKYIPTLSGFVDWLEKGGAEEQKVHMQSKNAVRIMTVHSAKGLQAPIVILADSASSEQVPHEQIFWKDGKFYMALSQEHGLNSHKLEQVKEHYKRERAEESQRLLYVAMTRAEDELYVAGWDNQFKNSSWHKTIADSDSNHRHMEKYEQIQPEQNVEITLLPDYITQIPHVSKTVSKKINATRGTDVQTPAMLRGEIIHDLLHKLPLISNQSSYIQAIKIKNRDSFSPSELDDIHNKVTKILTLYPDIFTPNTQSEVAITRKTADGISMAGRIDKLVFSGNTIKIIDFKSDVSTIDRSKYSKQLNFYANLLKEIYPEHKLETYLLWVESAELEAV